LARGCFRFLGDRSACRARRSAWRRFGSRVTRDVYYSGFCIACSSVRSASHHVCSGGCVSPPYFFCEPADKGRLGAHILGKARIDGSYQSIAIRYALPIFILSYLIIFSQPEVSQPDPGQRPARPFHYSQAPEEAACLTDRRQAGQLAGCTHPTIPRCKHGHSKSQER